MARRDEGFFSSRDNTRLYWQSLLPDADEPQDFVGIVHGYGDHSGRYRRVMESLVADGHGVLALDYRGHGKADGKRGHCSKWSEFLDDLTTFWARLRGMAGGKPTFLLGHSHGGLMVSHFMARKPEGLKGAVVTSPYYALAMTPPGAKVFGAKLAGTIIPWLPVATGITYDMLSRDESWQQETKDDPLYGKNATPRWFTEHLKAQADIRARGAEITTPLFMATAGADPIASTPTARAFFETIASADKTYKEYPGMKHEVLCELGKEEVWADISRWILQHR